MLALPLSAARGPGRARGNRTSRGWPLEQEQEKQRGPGALEATYAPEAWHARFFRGLGVNG